MITILYIGLFTALLITLLYFAMKVLSKQRKANRERKTRFIWANIKHNFRFIELNFDEKMHPFVKIGAFCFY